MDAIEENTTQLPLEACIAKSKIVEVDESVSNECARMLEALQPIDESQDVEFEEFDFDKEK